MRSKTIKALIAAALGITAVPALGSAQHAGLRIGIAQPQPRPAPVQPPAVAVRGGFRGTAPVLVGPPPQLTPLVPLVPHVPLVPNFPVVAVPNQVLIPGQTSFPPGPVAPSSNVFFPANPIQPGLPFVSGVSPVPAGLPFIGMGRADVLRQFGQPSVTVVTSTGETFYFTGGVTVFLQNGRVVSPK